MSRGVRVVTSSEVAVVGGDNGVGGVLGHVSAIPLADAGTTSVSEDDTTGLSEGVQDAIALDGGADLLRAGGDVELALGLDTMSEGLAGDGGRAGHVLIGGVSARACRRVRTRESGRG